MASAALSTGGLAGAPNNRSGMARARQVGSSLAAVIGVYVVYALLAVPLIEPSISDKSVTPRVSDEEIGEARVEVNARQREVASYFPPGSWELDNPAIWQSDQTRLLFKTLEPQPDGSVVVNPCTVLFFPKDHDPAAPKMPIIMRAPQGAKVRFDQPIVLKSVDLSKRQLEGGELGGVITITRAESQPGANDALEIVTRDVKMVKDRVFTPHPVKFRMGLNHGSGREMEILLAAAPGGGKGFKTGSLRTLRLKRDVQMELHMADDSADRRAAQAGAAPQTTPVTITCQGPFQFDFEQFAASFRDRVDVLVHHVAGESDQLNCALLTAHFDSRRGGSQPAEPSKKDATAAGSQVRLIEARGDPVTLRSPSRQMNGRCRGIDYAPGPPGVPGRLVALGPGVIQGQVPGDPTAKYDATWSHELRFVPDGARHVASLRGNVIVRHAQLGTINADEIFAWLLPAAPAQPAAPRSAGGAPPRWQLDRLLAKVSEDPAVKSQGPVVIDAPQMVGTTNKLEAWVEHPNTPAGAPSGPSGPLQAGGPRQKTGPAQPPTQRFDVRGAAIQIQLIPQDEQLSVTQVTLAGQARLVEMTPRAGEKPLMVQGNTMSVVDPTGERTHVTVSGAPGHIEAGGMTLDGATIELEKQANRLWVEGPGRMTMPMSQDMDGKPLDKPQSFDIEWKQRMDFRSDTVVYQGDVKAKSDMQFMQGDQLEAVLTRPIDFSNASLSAPNPAMRGTADNRPQLARVRCYGVKPVYLEGRQFDERGEQSGWDKMTATDLSINRISGAIQATGPGWVTHVSRTAGSGLTNRAGDAGKPAAPVGATNLTYLNVRFKDVVDGNLYQKQIRFGNRTTSVYGPINDWNAELSAENPAALGPNGFVLESQELFVREMPGRGPKERGWFEVEAVGNVVGEGAKFTARGARLTYSEEKDQLILSGDALSDAQLFQDVAGGGPRRESKAKALKYWFGLHRAEITGAQSFDMGMPKSSKPPAK